MQVIWLLWITTWADANFYQDTAGSLKLKAILAAPLCDINCSLNIKIFFCWDIKDMCLYTLYKEVIDTFCSFNSLEYTDLMDYLFFNFLFMLWDSMYLWNKGSKENITNLWVRELFLTLEGMEVYISEESQEIKSSSFLIINLRAHVQEIWRIGIWLSVTFLTFIRPVNIEEYENTKSQLDFHS